MGSGDVEMGKGDEIFSSKIPVVGRSRTKEEWKSTFVAKVQHSKSPMPNNCRIFRVPEVIRRQKKFAYQPDIVSIGPFHRGGKEFQRLENVKEWYLKCFLARNTKIEWDSLIASITEYETPARNCYAESLSLDQNDFVEMLILDGCFLIELFRKTRLPYEGNQDDPIFDVPCMLQYLYHDLLLLENQLPWFVLEFFYEQMPLIENKNTIKLSQVVIDFFKNSVVDDDEIFNYLSDSSGEILHILDLIRSALVEQKQQDNKSSPPYQTTASSSQETDQTTSNWLRSIHWALFRKQTPIANTASSSQETDQTTGNWLRRIHCTLFRKQTPIANTASSSQETVQTAGNLLRRIHCTLFRKQTPIANTATSSQETDQTAGNWLQRIHCAFFWKQTPIANIASSSQKTDRQLPQRIPSAVTLSEAGVKFRKGKPGCILNITFKHGVFTIPPLAIDERTGYLFRNLMAYEQCYQNRPHKITSYAVLMDNLIDTSKDVDLLCNKGIVANWLSAEDASKFFNELYNDTTVMGYSYDKLCADVEKYHKTRWNRWREKLMRDYFGTPWATISFFAAFVLLVLTFIQTIYTIHPYYHPRD